MGFLHRRDRIRLFSFTLAVLLMAIGSAVQSHHRAETYHRHLQYGYQHAFAELTTAVDELNTALLKASYSNSPALLGPLCTQIYGKAMSAQMALGELPYSNIELEQTASLLAKAGDYAMALSRSAVRSDSPSEETRHTLADLARVSDDLTRRLQTIQGDLYAGALALEDILQAEQRLAAGQNTNIPTASDSAFQNVEADFPEIPSLIYDGPFSEHLTGRQPAGLEGMSQAGMEEARETAALFLGQRPELLTFTSAGQGALPTWSFSADLDGGELFIEVTQKGGKVVQFFTSRPIGDATLSQKDGIAIARAFLASQGYPSMAESYFTMQGNVLTVNFASLEGDVICYPDLVKVSVALDRGNITGFESLGYWTCHHPRIIPVSRPVEEVQPLLSPDLEVLSHQPAYIPSAGSHEIFCHEFKCRTPDGRHIIVYLNGQTGAEEKILLLLEDETGTLVL